MEQKKGPDFDSALYGITPRIAAVLMQVPYEIKARTQEIRLRRGQPLTLTVGSRPAWVDMQGCVRATPDRRQIRVEDFDIADSFRLICRGSVYSHERELENGFIRMRYGHRAGICGRVTGANLSDITSINIRIARQVFGAADGVVRAYNGSGMLIAGAPGSGKTTVLRDLIRQLSSGVTGKYYRIAVIDTRGELSAMSADGTGNDLGPGADVLLSFEKGSGMQAAVRTLSPDIVAFDEIGTLAELEGVREGLHAGVSVITTAHIGAPEELYTRGVTASLLDSGAVATVVFLTGAGQPPRIFTTDGIKRLCGF